MLEVSFKRSINNPNAGSVKIKANAVLTQIDVVNNSGVIFLYLLEKVSLVLDICDSKFVTHQRYIKINIIIFIFYIIIIE
jgi:hypothetical protein